VKIVLRAFLQWCHLIVCECNLCVVDNSEVEVLFHMGGSLLQLHQFIKFVVKLVVSGLDFFLEFVFDRVLNVLPYVVPVVS
jgi:hypothetical protein